MKKLLCPLLLLLVMSACSKKDSGPSRTDLLRGSWQLTSSELDHDGNGSYEVDLFARLDACIKDDYVTFYNTGYQIRYEGLTACSPNDPPTETVTWQLSNDGNTLTVDGFNYEILELNNTVLKFKQAFPGGRSARSTFAKR